MRGPGSSRTYGTCWFPCCREVSKFRLICHGGHHKATAIFFSCPQHVIQLQTRLYRRAPTLEHLQNPLAAEV